MAGDSTRIRVLHVTFSMDFGGTEQVIAQLVRGLPEAEFVSLVACIDGNIGPMADAMRKQGVQVTALGRKPGLDWSLVRRLRDLVRRERIDVLHGHQYTPWFYAWLAALGTGAKVVFTEHGRFYPDHYRWKALWLNPVMALTSQAVVAISEATRLALARYEFIPQSRVQRIYNGIEPLTPEPGRGARVREAQGIPGTAFVLGTVARLDRVKNQGMLLDAAARMMVEDGNVWLLLIGDGPERQNLEQRADALGIRERVRFTGFQQRPGDYMQAMDLFLLTSWTEGTSMTLLEAMSLGLPCVATAVGGNPEIVEDGVTGRLVPCDDAGALYRHLCELRASPDDLARMGQQGRARFQDRFTVTKMVDAYAGLYRRISGSRSG